MSLILFLVLLSILLLLATISVIVVLHSAMPNRHSDGHSAALSQSRVLDSSISSIFDNNDALVVLNVDQANDLGLGDDESVGSSNRVIVSDHVDELFTCSNMSSLLSYDSDQPFRIGRHRTAWLARWFSGTQLRRYVVKRPLVRFLASGEPDVPAWRTSVQSLADEYAALSAFETWHVLVAFGGCFDLDAPVGSTRVGLVTEYFPHYTLTDMLYLPAPWCVRARVALGFVVVARQLADSPRGAAVMCDWSLSNFVVRLKDYRLVTVDLSSWHLLQTRRDGSAIPLHAGTKCNASASCDSTLEPYCPLSLGAELADPPPDSMCDARSHQCIGFDAMSHAWLLGRSLLRVLARGINTMSDGDDVLRPLGNATDAADDFWILTFTGDLEYQAVLMDVCEALAQNEKKRRMKLSTAESRLRTMMGRYNARDCLVRWQWHNRRH
jgi:hypothetical protein